MSAPVKAPIVADGGTSFLTSRQSTSSPILLLLPPYPACTRQYRPPIAGPPCFEPFGGTLFNVLENVADVVNQQCLRMLGKLLNQNIFHSEHLLVKLIVLLAGLHSFEIFYMVIPGRGNAGSNKMSNHGYEKRRKRFLPVG